MLVVWRNKPDLDTMSFDDLYNYFKIIKQEVKGTASSSSNSHNMAFVSSPSSTNEVNTAYGVGTANTQVSPASTHVSTASTQISTANLCDDTVYAFLVSQPNGSQLVHEDLEQIHKDDLEEMDLKSVSIVEHEDKKPIVANDEVPTNMALMAFLDFEFNNSEFNLANYKRGLASVEVQLVFYKKNEVIFCKQLAVLKRDISYKDSEISMLKRSQIPAKSRKGLGFVSYNPVPPPPTRLFSPSNLNLSNSGIEEFQQPEFEGYGPKTNKNVSEDTSNEVRESPHAPMVEKLVSNDKLEKKTVFPTVAKIEFVRPKEQEKSVRNHIKANCYWQAYMIKGEECGNNCYNNGESEGLTVPVESHHTPIGAPSTSQPHLSPTLKSSIRQETEVPQSSSRPHTNVADEAASTGVDVRYGGAATIVTGLEAG
ncbi:hypothetical protein Tco_0371540 [Tanacetum coccineum]